jgi:OCT family organic cation transporter-like MFS transporter 4/5
VTGFSVKGLYMMAFVLAVESVGPKFAAFIGIAINFPFAVGELILGLEAYLVRDWRTLQATLDFLFAEFEKNF